MRRIYQEKRDVPSAVNPDNDREISARVDLARSVYAERYAVSEMWGCRYRNILEE